jgi:uncharacterized protein (TIGR03437 family)
MLHLTRIAFFALLPACPAFAQPRIASAATAAGPQFSTGTVLNAASFLPSLAQGSAFSIFGSNLAAATASATTTPLPTALAGATVSVNGVAAPLYYASPTQINAQMPFEIAVGPATLVVTTAASASPDVMVQVNAAAPGLFASVSNHALVQNQDGSIDTPQNPAAPGTYIVVWFTGGGPVDNPVPTGYAASLTVLSPLTSNVTATIGATPVTVIFAGLAPGQVGIDQLDIHLPIELPSGSLPLKVAVNGVAGNTLAVDIR